MRIRIVGSNSGELRPEVAKFGFEVVDTEEDLIIAYGGDGTLLWAEREFPGVPKLVIRRSRICKKCERHSNDVVFACLKKGEFSETHIRKLEGCIGDKRFLAINDVIVHNNLVTSGVRYRVWINDEPYSDEIVGDGLVVATPFGSSAYYRSITHSIFHTGIGLAFNNSTEPVDHLVLGEKDIVRVLITRGPAVVAADNNPNTLQLSEGDEVRIELSESQATIFSLDTLLCNHCLRLVDGNWTPAAGPRRFAVP